MIDFHFETNFSLKELTQYSDWITRIIESEGRETGKVDYIFCSDDYLLEMNQRYLNHDTFTDIVTFDYSEEKLISGDIFISIDRVKDNAVSFNVDCQEELLRVMSHGVLHLIGYKDKGEDEIKLMRKKENEKIKLFHVEP
ncbi:rRNA maturation RNase YbeY [Flagellimonas sp. W118]|uniref:rRNA maturation RNase YbeY n=1 Tax=Flagellimonas sp. W118 TaxID=3410791 RepID=UPI003BF59A65